MILDSSFVIDVFNGEPAARTLKDEIDEKGTAGVSAITAFELAIGIEKSDRSDDERDRVRSFLDGTREIEVNREIAFETADIKVTLDRAGEPIELPDVFIGATARVQNEPVVTRNPKHFERIEGINTRSYKPNR